MLLSLSGDEGNCMCSLLFVGYLLCFPINGKRIIANSLNESLFVACLWFPVHRSREVMALNISLKKITYLSLLQILKSF